MYLGPRDHLWLNSSWARQRLLARRAVVAQADHLLHQTIPNRFSGHVPADPGQSPLRRPPGLEPQPVSHALIHPVNRGPGHRQIARPDGGVIPPAWRKQINPI